MGRLKKATAGCLFGKVIKAEQTYSQGTLDRSTRPMAKLGGVSSWKRGGGNEVLKERTLVHGKVSGSALASFAQLSRGEWLWIDVRGGDRTARGGRSGRRAKVKRWELSD